MPYRRSAYGQQGTRPGRRRRPRRRGSVSTRIRYQRPSARNQRSQIRTLARIALKNRSILSANKVYTDWFLNQQVTPSDGTWYSQELMSPVSWTAGNRQDADFIVSQTAYVRNMILEYYISSQDRTADSSFDIYIVSLRNSAANWVPQTTPSGVWQDGVEYTSAGNNNSAFVNSGIFKVHYNKQIRLAPKVDTNSDPTGNPWTNYKNVKVNLSIKSKVRAPTGLSWKNLTMASLPPAQRMWLIWRATSTDSTNAYLMNYALHATAVGLS